MTEGGRETASPEAFDEIINTDPGECSVAVCLASLTGEDNIPEFQRLQLKDELADEYKAVAARVFQQHAKDSRNNELRLHPYVPGSNLEPHEVEHLNLAEHGHIAEQITSLGAPVELGIFDDNEGFKSGLKFYVIILQRENEEPIYCFRTYSAKKELTQSTLFGAMLDEGHFDKVREPLLLFDRYIDCITRGNDLFVLKKNNFHRIFRFFERVQEMGRKILENIGDKVSIQNFEDFAEACIGHPLKLAKLRNISERALIERVEMSDIKSLIHNYGLDIEIVKDEESGLDMLVYDPAQQWEILRLLDDGYLESRLTNEQYEVSSKRPHKA